MPLVFDVVDPQGVRVVLEEDVWANHIVMGHGELRGCEDAIAETVRNPHFIYTHAQSRLYYNLGACDRYPSLYFLVVVKTPGAGDAYGPVRTAYLQATPPSKGELVWMLRN